MHINENMPDFSSHCTCMTALYMALYVHDSIVRDIVHDIVRV